LPIGIETGISRLTEAARFLSLADGVEMKKTITAVTVLVIVLAVTSGAFAAKGLLTGADIKNGSLTGADVQQHSLGAGTFSATAKSSLRGAQGQDGTTGPDGLAGLRGFDGFQGAQGNQGRAGLDGYDGTNGFNGADGSNGRDGLNGTNGIDGTNGVDGTAADGAACMTTGGTGTTSWVATADPSVYALTCVLP
jgi:hypothetical protein